MLGLPGAFKHTQLFLGLVHGKRRMLRFSRWIHVMASIIFTIFTFRLWSWVDISRHLISYLKNIDENQLTTLTAERISNRKMPFWDRFQ